LLRGGKASQASDVFSLGVILYEMVTGQKPFPPKTDNNGDVHPPVPTSQLVKGLPHRWDKSILPCLKSKAEDRISAREVLAALESKPWYVRPAVIATLAASLLLAAMIGPQILARIVGPPIHLAVLPVEAPADLAQRGNQMLNVAADRMREVQTGEATVAVIPLAKALKKNVTTPEEAAKVLGATHVLKVKLLPEADGVAAQAAIIDLKTMAHVREYSGQFPSADFSDLPVGLTGSVALALHLHRTPKAETVAKAAEPRYESGLKYLEREPHDFVDAINEFQEAARLDPHSPLPLAGLSAAHVREYQATKKDSALNDAKLWLAKAEALNADSPKVRLASGLLHQVAGDYANARLDYQRVEEIDPGNVEALLGIGFSYESQSLLDQTMAAYHRAITVAPGNYKPYEYLGAMYYYRGRYADAVGPFQREIQCAPDRVDAYANLAGAYIAQGKYHEAEEVFARSPKGTETAAKLNNIGAKLAFQGHDPEAIYYYKRAIEQSPNRAIYWLNLGDSQRRTAGPAQAKAAYKRGLEVAGLDVTTNPGSASARGYLAYLQVRIGRKAQAKTEIAQALNAPTKDDQVLLCAVQTYEALGDRQRALAAARQASIQTLREIAHHPDLADLNRDPRFIVLLGQSK
jgi:tetratricopeptide (TPR) repeat protein